jgi:hypothetical protein
MNAARAARRWWNRRRLYTRAELNSERWPHPRPSRDPRLICMNIGLTWVSLLQIGLGPAPTSVQERSWEYAATIAFGVMAIVSSALVLYAAFCHSQYWSFITELGGCAGFVLVFSLYTWALVTSTPHWWSTNIAGWCIPLLAGNALRALIIGRRFW